MENYSEKGVLIKPASSACNMACPYCFYKDIKPKPLSVMSKETTEGLLERLMAPVKGFCRIFIAFQGGEPTLAGLDYFKHFIETVNRLKQDNQEVSYTLQTNGLDLNDDWFHFFKDNNFLIGISIDGWKEHHDAMRPDHKGEGTYERIFKNFKRMQEIGVEMNILTVLTEDLAQKPDELFDYYESIGISYVQLIPCLSLFDNPSPYALTPPSFAACHTRMAERMFSMQRHPGALTIANYMSVIELFSGYSNGSCGALGNCAIQNVIESDGSVYPCDFYVMDEYCLGKGMERPFEQWAMQKPASVFLNVKTKGNNLCSSCQFEPKCHGHCKRQAPCFYSDDYCGYKVFLENALPYFQNTIDRVKKELGLQ